MFPTIQQTQRVPLSPPPDSASPFVLPINRNARDQTSPAYNAIKARAQEFVDEYNKLGRRLKNRAISPTTGSRTHARLKGGVKDYSQNLGKAYSDSLRAQFILKLKQRTPPSGTRPIDRDEANYHHASIAWQHVTGQVDNQEALKQHGEILDRRVKTFIDAAENRELLKVLTRSVENDFRQLSTMLGDAHEGAIWGEVEKIRRQEPSRQHHDRPAYGTGFVQVPQGMQAARHPQNRWMRMMGD